MRTLYAAGPWQAGDEVTLDGDEARHGRTVLRLRLDDAVRLIDGAGGVAEARVSISDRRTLAVRIGRVDQQTGTPASQLTVAVCPPKGSRFEDMVRSLTELGVGAIRPLLSERAIRAPNLARAGRVALEACKQSRRAHLPQLGPMAEFTSLAGLGGERILLDPDGEPVVPGLPCPTTLIIGPEGGLTEAERAALVADGVRTVRLAPHVLRIETAAIAAAATWIAAWEQHERPADQP